MFLFDICGSVFKVQLIDIRPLLPPLHYSPLFWFRQSVGSLSDSHFQIILDTLTIPPECDVLAKDGLQCGIGHVIKYFTLNVSEICWLVLCFE